MGVESDIEKFFSTMTVLGKLMNQHMQETYDERTATFLQFSALSYLKAQPNVTVSALATNLTISKSSATQLVERLVKAGFVDRKTDEQDRRIIRLMITLKGEEECLKLKKDMLAKMQKVLGKLPAQDLRELIRIHTNLIETLKKEEHV